MSLKRLPLSVLRPGEPVQANVKSTKPAAEGSGQPAALTRQNVRLVLATRLQVSRLSGVEAALLGAAAPAGAEPPSVLRGSIIRFVSKGRYRLDFVKGTSLDESGGLVLNMQDFGRPIPLMCLSSSSPLEDDALFEQQGRAELAALGQRVALTGLAPTRRQLAAACHRLSLGWLWAEQLEALRSAVQKDAAAVAALLDDPAAVAGLLPCFEAGEETAATAEAGPAAAAGMPPLPVEGGRPHAAGAEKPSAGRGAAAAPAAVAHGSSAAQTRPAVGPQEQQQQQQQQQEAGHPSLPVAKRQRTKSAAKESTPSAVQLEPGELPPAEAQHQQQQQQQRRQQQQAVASAVQAHNSKQQTAKQQGQKQPAAVATPASAAAKTRSPGQQQPADEQGPLPGNVMPPGSKLESLLLEAVGMLDIQARGGLQHLAALGQAVAKLDRNWKRHVPSSYGLARLVMELKRRGLVHAQVRDSQMYVGKLPPLAPPPPPPQPPALFFAPYYAHIPPGF